MIARTDEEDADYLIILKTSMIEPVFNIGVIRKSASIEVDITIEENNQKKNSIAKISMTKIPETDDMGYDFDSGRIFR